MTNILFVCTGNTCRSPLAEAIFNNKNNDESIQAKSAGIFAADGVPMSEGSDRALKKRNITVEHSAQAVTGDLIEWADVVLTMTNNHKSTLIEQYPKTADNIFTLKEYVTDNSEIKNKLEKLKKYRTQLELKRVTSFSKNRRRLNKDMDNITKKDRLELEQLLLKEIQPDIEAIESLLAELPSFDITDPYGGDDTIYEETYKEIEEDVEKLFEKIKNNDV